MQIPGVAIATPGVQNVRGRSSAMLGSVAERIVRLAPCPVLTVKDAEAD
jgi:nucleotide-binding universal stress UspA family protein